MPGKGFNKKSTARGITKEIKSAKTLYQVHQFNNEQRSEYYERFKPEVDAYQTYTVEKLSEDCMAALFTNGLHNSIYDVMSRNRQWRNKATTHFNQSLSTGYEEGGRNHRRRPVNDGHSGV